MEIVGLILVVCLIVVGVMAYRSGKSGDPLPKAGSTGIDGRRHSRNREGDDGGRKGEER